MNGVYTGAEAGAATFGGGLGMGMGGTGTGWDRSDFYCATCIEWWTGSGGGGGGMGLLSDFYTGSRATRSASGSGSGLRGGGVGQEPAINIPLHSPDVPANELC
jgi:hypothetical protein